MRVRPVVICNVVTPIYLICVAVGYVLVILLRIVPSSYFIRETKMAFDNSFPLPIPLMSQDISINKFYQLDYSAYNGDELVPVVLYQFPELPSLGDTNVSFWFNATFCVDIDECLYLPEYAYSQIHFQWNSTDTLDVSVADAYDSLITNGSSTFGEGLVANNGNRLNMYQFCFINRNNPPVNNSIYLFITTRLYNLSDYIQQCNSSCSIPVSNNSLVYFIDGSMVPKAMLYFDVYVKEYISIPGLIAAPLSMFFACTIFCWCLVASKCSSDPCVCCDKKAKPKKSKFPYKVEMDVFNSEKIWPCKIWTPKNHLSYPLAKQKQIIAFLIIMKRSTVSLHEPIIHKICNYIAQSDDYLTILHLEEVASEIHKARQEDESV
eukprot:Phypoly_transcript_10231.p1 GENE.Phypoly_transcript_10231~~Phypoly_transcript_10231.p1  ORF type:complete len:378 (+),score=35.61 Phypoly_transcript_10231:166-1299(+)